MHDLTDVFEVRSGWTSVMNMMSESVDPTAPHNYGACKKKKKQKKKKKKKQQQKKNRREICQGLVNK